MQRKTAEEKEKIVIEIEKSGQIIEGCRKYGISASTYYQWHERYHAGGLKGLKSYRSTNDANTPALEKENSLLKELVAEKELIIKMQQEVIKKKLLQWNKKGI
jgi:putative transposase